MRQGKSLEGTLVLIVVFGIVMVIFAILYRELYDIGDKEFTKKECQSSLLLTRSFDVATPKPICIKPVDNPIPIKCSRRFLTVTEHEVLKDGESIKFNYNPSCDGSPIDTSVKGRPPAWGGACLVENVLAQEMASCWGMFFEGEMPVFQQVDEELFSIFSDTHRACFVCSEVTVSSKNDVENFVTYLKTNNALVAENAVSGKTYYEYLARNKKAFCSTNLLGDSTTCWDGMAKNISYWFNSDWPGVEQNTFETGKTYAVTFVRHGMSTCRDEDDPDDIPSMTVQLLPADSIEKYCGAVLV